MLPEEERLITLGAIARPHGVRGELRVHRFNPDSTLLLELDDVWLRRDGEARRMRIERARAHGPAVLMELEGIRGREAAEALRGAEVCVPREALPDAGDDEVYHADLIGLRAELADGTPVGEVVDILSYPSADCLLVREENVDREVPLLDPYVQRVDLEARVAVVAHLEDLEPIRRKR
jgi:16S rRNA processing protein RimM